MKLLNNILSNMLLFAAVVGLVSCGGDKTDGGTPVPAGKKTDVTLNLTFGIGAPATINNVWVLEWDANGNNKVAYKERYQTIAEPLQAELVAGEGMQVCIIAGVDDSFTFVLGTPLNEFKERGYASRMTSDAQVPYSGFFTMNIDKEGLSSNLELSKIAAKISFKVTPSDPSYAIKTIQLKNIPTKVLILPSEASSAAADFKSDNLIAENFDQTYTYFIGANPQGIDAAITKPEDRITNKFATYVEVIAEKVANNVRTTSTFVSYYGDNETSDFNVNRGGVYTKTLTVNFDNKSDKRISQVTSDASLDIMEVANSYMITPNSDVPIAIPVSRVNDFWGTIGDDDYYMIDNGRNGGRVKQWIAKVIWETSPGLVEFIKNEGTSPSEYIVLNHGMPQVAGNALIGIFDNTKGGDVDPKTAKVLWSWHIWVTDYFPGGDSRAAIPKVAQVPGRTEVPGGAVQQFEGLSSNPTKDGSESVIMDRDLGALGSDLDNLKLSTGLYYQFGRKDPFPVVLPVDEDVPYGGYPWTGSIPTPVAGATNLFEKVLGPVRPGKAVNTPTILYLGSTFNPVVKDWLEGGNNNEFLWKDKVESTVKTIYDPCPPGWRIPADTRTFKGLDVNYLPTDWTGYDPSKVDEQDRFIGWRKQGILCYDQSAKVLLNSSGRINGLNGNLFSYAEACYLFMGTQVHAGNAYILYCHPTIGYNDKEGTGVEIMELADTEGRTAACPVRCVKH